MINLVPPQGKKLITREYLVRVFSVGALSLSLALVASTVALAPAYALFSVPSAAPSVAGVASTSTALSNESHTEPKATELLSAAMILAHQLQRSKDTIAAFDVVTHIESALSPAIHTDSMSFSEDKSGVLVQLHGIAATREGLKQFIDALKKDTYFTNAQVPVSDLAHDVDAAFTMTLNIRPHS